MVTEAGKLAHDAWHWLKVQAVVTSPASSPSKEERPKKRAKGGAQGKDVFFYEVMLQSLFYTLKHISPPLLFKWRSK